MSSLCRSSHAPCSQLPPRRSRAQLLFAKFQNQRDRDGLCVCPRNLGPGIAKFHERVLRFDIDIFEGAQILLERDGEKAMRDWHGTPTVLGRVGRLKYLARGQMQVHQLGNAARVSRKHRDCEIVLQCLPQSAVRGLGLAPHARAPARNSASLPRGSQCLSLNFCFRPNLVVPRLGSDSQKQSFTKLGCRLRIAHRGHQRTLNS